MPMKIDPEAWYSERDLSMLLNVSPDRQRQEREAGQLRFAQTAGAVLYRGQWLQEWLAGKTAQKVEPTAQPTGYAAR